MLEAQKEIQDFGTRMQRMFGMVQELRDLSASKNNDKSGKTEAEFVKLYSRNLNSAS